MKKALQFLALGLWLALQTATAQGQDLHADSVKVSSPYYLKAQFAGDIGLLSVGVGRQAFNSKLETDLSLGYLPKFVGGDDIFTLAVKSTFLPYRSVRIKNVDWKPITLGVQLGYTFGKEYFASERYLSRYPNSYYRFSTALNFYLFAGGQVNLTRVKKVQKFAGYYEFGTMGEYLISYLNNPRYLSPAKIMNLAFGMKYYL
ncbi:hypothetical protein ACFSC6_05960 [Rufibacter sediminis]|uniref:Outer membrane protein beta-barrel domain-containing protein n=1 Tax=Rufibacter sediminis TaxID=2762756 RepID=A0ABR6VR37_9BACT|nr:hypothetical protein [Rufibacter sediminis]MBC3539318.1 hypothetical protein [Rufibacter sediminis]